MKGILTLNAGSSSIKFSLYPEDVSRSIYQGSIDNLQDMPVWRLKEYSGDVYQEHLPLTGHHAALDALARWITKQAKHVKIEAVGHRMVHGGRHYTAPEHLTEGIIKDLEHLFPLAPLHQPYNVEAARRMLQLFPDAFHMACFDTAFHTTIDKRARSYAIPRRYTQEGIIKYGFHGLSYEYIASVLPEMLNDKANGKIIVAHLGNGASMCAMRARRSVDTTMGFTALDGLIMGTRTGRIDPGIVLYLQQEAHLSVKQVEHLLYKESGLLGVSGISHDMRHLENSDDPAAREAVDMFCYRAAQEVAGLMVSLGGMDALVFTAGIGEHSPYVRQEICRQLPWLDIRLDDQANAKNKILISRPDSGVGVYVIPTNEELVIARHCAAALKGGLEKAQTLY